MLKQEPRNHSTRRRGEWLLLLAIIAISGYFRFHGLAWNDYAWPHPDERAIISQTYDLLVSNSYQPHLPTWGSLSYYSTLFCYKGYLYFQNWPQGIPLTLGEPMSPPPGSPLPQIRNLVHSGYQVHLGIFAVFLVCAVYGSLRLVCRHRLAADLLLVLSILILPVVYPVLREIMLTPVSPNYEDVAFLGRFLSALASTLCVPIIYAIGRRLFSSRVGLWRRLSMGSRCWRFSWDTSLLRTCCRPSVSYWQSGLLQLSSAPGRFSSLSPKRSPYQSLRTGCGGRGPGRLSCSYDGWLIFFLGQPSFSTWQWEGQLVWPWPANSARLLFFYCRWWPT